MVKIIAFLIFSLWNSSSMSNTFSEVFGSEGAAGIENSKTRSLSYTLQYATLAGSIGYVVKQLHDTGFLQPLGFTPNSFTKLSPLAYKKNYLLDSHSANVIAVSQKVEKLNYYNDLKMKLAKRRYSARAIEIRGKKNISDSLNKYNNRISILEKYNEK